MVRETRTQAKTRTLAEVLRNPAAEKVTYSKTSAKRTNHPPQTTNHQLLLLSSRLLTFAPCNPRNASLHSAAAEPVTAVI